MSLTLDLQTEQRIQREMERGHFREPSEVINHALDLLEADDSWAAEERAELGQSLELAAAQIKRGEGIPGERLREHLAQRRVKRVA
jgi:Arc/MetJ-type ribon-helix-helix transcriptional regulator